MGEALRQTLNARLDGELPDRETELRYALERLTPEPARSADS
jgi:hypothetical protein